MADRILRLESDIAKAVRIANRSEIARRANLSLSGVSRILNGKRNPRSTNLAAIAAVMEVSVDDLYTYLLTLQGKRQFLVKMRAEAADRGRTPVFAAEVA